MSETPDSPASAQANLLWAGLLVEELVRCGVETFFVAPGSRSTPLVAAAAENPEARAVVHFDERGCAFAALGHARATGRPAAWITTSGTAVANGFPAIVEAATDNVPMVLLTADRPPELRQTGANQTIDQPRIFGGYVRWEFDVPAPDQTTDPAFLLGVADQAVYRARRAPAGPVHLNLMFREPLLPEPSDDRPEVPKNLPRWHKSGSPHTVYAAAKPSVSAAEVRPVAAELRGVERGLVLAGRLPSRDRGEAAVRLARTLGWPLLADIGSQVRLGAPEAVVPNYGVLLAGEGFAQRMRPQAVVQVGGPPVSKRLSRLLAESRPAPYVVVREGPARLDPDHVVTRSVESDIVAFCEALGEELTGEGSGAPDSAWTEGWREASRLAERRIEEAASEAEGVEEPLVAREVSKLVPEGNALVVASSLPVRDLDTFAAADGPAVPVAANRGASGIDGTVATAAGFARGLARPVTLLVGDLALLHDLNSLALLRDLPVTVVAVNNDGGGIFSTLPVSRHETFFERYFGTPHGLGFEPAARMFGLAYENPKTMEGFREAYLSRAKSGSAALIEVRTDRARGSAFREGLLRRATEGLGKR